MDAIHDISIKEGARGLCSFFVLPWMRNPLSRSMVSDGRTVVLEEGAPASGIDPRTSASAFAAIDRDDIAGCSRSVVSASSVRKWTVRLSRPSNLPNIPVSARASDLDLHYNIVIITPDTALKKFFRDIITTLAETTGVSWEIGCWPSTVGRTCILPEHFHFLGRPFRPLILYSDQHRVCAGLHVWEDLSFPESWTVVRLGRELSFGEVTIRVSGRHRWVTP